jgi:hypothetical protein
MSGDLIFAFPEDAEWKQDRAFADPRDGFLLWLASIWQLVTLRGLALLPRWFNLFKFYSV